MKTAQNGSKHLLLVPVYISSSIRGMGTKLTPMTDLDKKRKFMTSSRLWRNSWLRHDVIMTSFLLWRHNDVIMTSSWWLRHKSSSFVKTYNWCKSWQKNMIYDVIIMMTSLWRHYDVIIKMTALWRHDVINCDVIMLMTS